MTADILLNHEFADVRGRVYVEPLAARVARMVLHNRQVTADAFDHGWPANRAPGRHYAKRGTS